MTGGNVANLAKALDQSDSLATGTVNVYRSYSRSEQQVTGCFGLICPSFLLAPGPIPTCPPQSVDLQFRPLMFVTRHLRRVVVEMKSKPTHPILYATHLDSDRGDREIQI
jgi:hypothetical protein